MSGSGRNPTPLSVALFIALFLFIVVLAVCIVMKKRRDDAANNPPQYSASPRTGLETVVAFTPRGGHEMVTIPSAAALVTPAPATDENPSESTAPTYDTATNTSAAVLVAPTEAEDDPSEASTTPPAS
ncbi:hypothetical protein BC828DRAFT_399752 [Blastocladiella britannica]|nr:hypothetical protein BC828DRAFT_399752 [Blastocladiella britannica]